MDVEDLFRKLRPVMGTKLDGLWLEYQLEPRKRQEIEGFLRVAVAKHFGPDGKRPILVEPPPPDVSGGEYALGTVVYGGAEVGSFGIREHEWIQHAGIFGRSGSGKTNVGFLILAALKSKNVPILVFDWKRNYRDLVAIPPFRDLAVLTVGRDVVPFTFNPLCPPPDTEPEIFLKKLIEIMMHVYWLGEGVAYLLQRAIDSVYEQAGVYRGRTEQFPTLFDVRDWLRTYKAKGREALWMDSTRRVMETLCFGQIGKVVGTGRNNQIEDILKTNAVLELDALANSDKTFLIESILLWLHHKRMREPQRERLRHAILIEEAHHVLLRSERKETVMDVVLREIRELSESIIFIDQHPSLVSIPSLGNSYCTIAMNLKHGQDVSALGRAMLLNEEERDYVGKLPVGEALVRLQGRWPKPFHVKFPLFEVEKGKIKDADLVKPSGGDSAVNDVLPAIQPARGEIPVVPRGDKAELGIRERKVLDDVMRYPIDGARERIDRLGLSTRVFYAVLTSLIEKEFVSVDSVSTGKGRKQIVRVSPIGRASLGLPNSGERNESPEHWYWKIRLAALFEELGYKVEVEKDGADIALEKGGMRVAVEIETGKSNVDANIERDLANGFDRVIVAWTRRSGRGSITGSFGPLVSEIVAGEVPRDSYS